MSRYMPLTDVDHPIPTILIDTHAPLDALHATADYRIRIVTQLLETLTSKQRTCNDPTLINDLMGGWSFCYATAAMCWTLWGDAYERSGRCEYVKMASLTGLQDGRCAVGFDAAGE